MPSVLIQDQTPRDQYTATNGQTVFNYSFTLFAETDMEVYSRADDDIEPDDYNQQLRLNIDYTVNLINSTITLLTPAGVGQIVTLVRNMPEERLNLYTNGTPITADALNTDQESAVLMAQQNTMYSRVLGVQYNKSAIIDYTNPQGGDTILPVLLPGQTWVKDPTNNFIDAVNIGSGGGGGDVQMLQPGVTGSHKGSVARWNSSGVLTDSVVNIDDNGNLTGAASGKFGNIRIGVTDPNTIDTVATDLNLTAAAGKQTKIGTLGEALTLAGLKWPAADGTGGQVITTDGAGNLTFANSGGGAPFASTKYNLVQFSNTTGGLQDSGLDYQGGTLSGATQIDVGNLRFSGNNIATSNTNGNLFLSPNGTGVVVMEKSAAVLSGGTLGFQNPSNTNIVTFKAGALTQSTDYTLPLVDGANGEVLTTNGAGVLQWTTGGGGGGGGNWVQTATVTAAGSATVDLIGAFSASYTRYMIVARNVTFQTATANFWMRIGTGATPTWKSGAADYSYALDGYTSAAATSVAGSTGAAQILLASSVSASADLPTSFILNIFDPANAAFKTPIIAQVEASSSATTLVEQSISGAYLTAEAVSSIQFLASAGNIVSGVFEVYGFNPAGGGGGGSIAGNVVQTVYTTPFHITVGTIGAYSPLPFSVVITPSSSTSRVKISFGATFSNATSSLILYRNGVAINVGGTYIGAFNTQVAQFTYIDSPATTLPITYQMYTSFGIVDFQVGMPIGSAPALTFTAEEVGPP